MEFREALLNPRKNSRDLKPQLEGNDMSDLLKKLAAKFSPHEMAESAAQEEAEHEQGKEKSEKGERGLKGWMAKRKRKHEAGESKKEEAKEEKSPVAAETNEKMASTLLEKLSAKKGEKIEPGSLKGGKDEPSSKDKPGEGGRFKALVKKLKNKKGVKDPEALAGALNRGKYGPKGAQGK